MADPATALTRSQLQLRLSREERDYIAGHALDSMKALAIKLGQMDCEAYGWEGEGSSDRARKIAALSNLLGDIGWARPGQPEHLSARGVNKWVFGELFPVAQLRPWLEGWQRQNNEALVKAEQALEILGLGEPDGIEPNAEGHARRLIAAAQTKLGTGAILLARIEKWMASHGN